MNDKVRECPSCALEGPADAEECPYCGYEYPAEHGRFSLGMALLMAALMAWPVFELIRYLL